MTDIFCPCCNALLDQTNVEAMTVTNQNIVDSKDSFGLTIQRATDKEQPHIIRLIALKAAYQAVWELMNP